VPVATERPAESEHESRWRAQAWYGVKRADLVEGFTPLGALGWTWPTIPVGMHLLISHVDGLYARGVAARSSLDLALLSALPAGAAP
jgi:hypothetical protein